MKRILGIAMALGLVGALTVMAQAVTLPDPLLMADGTPITDAGQWRGERRPELIQFLTREMYGQMPPKPQAMTFQVVDNEARALGGKATRRQVRVFFNGKADGPQMDLLLYLPNDAPKPVPMILGLNFWGNHAVHADPGIRITQSWMESGRNSYVDLSGVKDHRATGACRGINAKQWPVEEILARGYGLATVYRGDIAPDTPHDWKSGLHGLYPTLQGRGDNFATIGAWAWGLSRALDYLVTDEDVSASRVAVFGWSRLGKAALWAGAKDERFALVLSHQSGAGGAKLFHRGVGENITRLNTVFPHWFAANFRRYNNQDTSLPWDQHQVIALVAPRPVFIASAQDDKLADPEGEFASARAANPVFRLLGTDGLPTGEWPQPLSGQVGYFMRPGGHDVTREDWQQHLTFADKHLKKNGR